MILAQTVHQIYDRVKPSETAFRLFFFKKNFDNCQPEVASDVISGVVHRYEGSCKIWFKKSKSNRSQDIRLPHFVTNDDNDAFCLKIGHAEISM